ncbi:DUF4880 domain-containing protein [Variovorax sp. EL159]|uniref:FecR/PupR family sigma factor regulator n=1 Tax=Variovorax sp. EL159 TaxID=1566270 RepID=UPI00087EAF4E|nr:DUF4880 domain-containing protein [Variovorax sp. EL159]SCX65573.1 protein of unknown function [Variovorax sp. EL159]
MEAKPHDDRPRDARSDDSCLSEALDWLVRLNRFRAGEAEFVALEAWCARSTAHAQAWREAMALWLLLPVACEQPRHARRPRIPAGACDIRISSRSADSFAASDNLSPNLRPRQSWS